MANVVNNIIQDVVFRTKEKNAVMILRALNRVYTRLNRKYKPIQKELEMDFADVYPVTTWAKPDDLIEIYNIDPLYEFVPANKWSDERTGDYYTVDQNLFKFADVTEDTVVTVSYHSAGLTLVDADDDDVGTGQTNTPEWPTDLHQILLYHTCLEIADKYPLMAKDIAALAEMEQHLGETRWRVQSRTAEPIGGLAPEITSDPDDYE
jgi:hypothetical protein